MSTDRVRLKTVKYIHTAEYLWIIAENKAGLYLHMWEELGGVLLGENRKQGERSQT